MSYLQRQNEELVRFLSMQKRDVVCFSSETKLNLLRSVYVSLMYFSEILQQTKRNIVSC